MKNIIAIISLLFIIQIQAQEQENQKTYETKFVEIAPKIDAYLDDDAWTNTNIATNFVMFSPGSGTPEPENLKTEVRMVYDNEAVYIAAYLHDDEPEKIPMEFQTRDNFGNADIFGVALNPQNDGINQTLFLLMSTGNQNDAKVLSNGREDWSWNAVWYSQVRLVDDGWIAELKIPYSALRFSNEPVQTWGVNFVRRHERTRDQYTWNFIPKDQGSLSQYDGLLTGIKNIHTPVRLSFYPYASGSIDENEGNYEFGKNVGLDIKYGITENFTLDATLIPDFGQTSFDEEVLNLSPFEVKYSEKRQFFTEGVDLFSKGDLFYTRRVGSTPTGYYSLNLSENDSLIENPDKVDMYNATKVSGRTKDGLGIGVFNAVTKKTEAIIYDIENDTIRKEVTEPLSNYNVIVLDQQFNKNSSITLINTSVIRQGSFRDADVLGVLYNMKTQDNKYGVKGGVAMSNILEKKWTRGFEGSFEIGKTSGKHQYDVKYSFQDNQYNKTDMGYQRKNNVMSLGTSYSYRIFEPQGIFNNFGFYLWTESDFIFRLNKNAPTYQFRSKLYTGSYTGISLWATTKKHISFGGNVNMGIGKQYDYDEPLMKDRFYKKNPNIGFNAWVSSDYRKKLALNASFYLGTKVNDLQNFKSFSIAPRFRVNNHILLQHRFNLSKANNQKGLLGFYEEGIGFGERDILSIVNSFATKYNFDTKSSIGLTFRHYLSQVDYTDELFILNEDGSLADPVENINQDLSINIWNFDLSYSFEFAPGSQLSLLYRNSIRDMSNSIESNFIENLSNMYSIPLNNQLSLKLIYYLDYNTIWN